jgi:hypothetical protein
VSTREEKEDKYVEELTTMILEGRKEEEELATAIHKILKFVNEGVSPKWEYRVINDCILHKEEINKFINILGGDGWELCTITDYYGDMNRKTLIFKRRK